MRRFLQIAGIMLMTVLAGCTSDNDAGMEWKLDGVELIDFGATDFDIRYALYVDGRDMYVGYYDRHHMLKVAKRDASGKWEYVSLPENVNWDSHRYISMAVDNSGYLHLSGNMHSHPLVYYRSRLPGDIRSLEKVSMTGIFEDSVTYPEFLKTDSDLYFHYRNGRSGNGSTYFNRLNMQTGEWEKLSMESLFDGKGEANSYFKGPVAGPDGNFHMIWCWRDTPHCETNHGLYYAWSPDLKEWHSTKVFSKALPITLEDSGFLIDDIKVREGLINGGFALGFDDNQRPIISYHKYDENGHTNVFSAVPENDGWKTRRITDWHWKWDFKGKGSIPFLLTMDKATRHDSIQYLYIGKMQDGGIENKKMVPYLISFDERTGISTQQEYTDYPSEIDIAMQKDVIVHKEFDMGYTKDNDTVKFLLRYQTPYPKRDKKTDLDKRSGGIDLIKIIRNHN